MPEPIVSASVTGISRKAVFIFLIFISFLIWYFSGPTKINAISRRYKYDASSTAVGCAAFWGTNTRPELVEWTGTQTSWESLEKQVMDKAWTSWYNKDYSTQYLPLENIFAVRVTQAKGQKMVHAKENITEAIHGAMEKFSDHSPDAFCVFGKAKNGIEIAFVWGTDGDKVEATECTQKISQDVCVITRDETMPFWDDPKLTRRRWM